MRRAWRIIIVVVLILSASWSTLTARAQTPSPGDPAYRAGGMVLGASPGSAPVTTSAPPASPQGPPQRGTLQVPEVQLTTQVAFGRPVDSVTAFPPDHPAIFVWFRYAGAQPGSTLTARLVFLARAGEIEAINTTDQLLKPDDVGYFKFTAPSDGWPEGRYRLDLVANGATVRAQEFQVRRAR